MNELAHYGVLGMKWGVRRSPAQLSTSSVKKMSDDDLKKSISRLSMEKQYKQLLAESSDSGGPRESKGKKAAAEFLKSSGKIVLAKIASGLGEYLSKRLFDGMKIKLDAKNESEKERLDKAKKDKVDRQAKKEESKKESPIKDINPTKYYENFSKFRLKDIKPKKEKLVYDDFSRFRVNP